MIYAVVCDDRVALAATGDAYEGAVAVGGVVLAAGMITARVYVEYVCNARELACKRGHCRVGVGRGFGRVAVRIFRQVSYEGDYCGVVDLYRLPLAALAKRVVRSA